MPRQPAAYDPLLTRLATLRRALNDHVRQAASARAHAHTLFERLLFVRLGQLCGVLPDSALTSALAHSLAWSGDDEHARALAPLMVADACRDLSCPKEAIVAAIDGLREDSLIAALSDTPPDILGRVYQTGLARKDRRQDRKSTGSFYTPSALGADLIQQTVAPCWHRRADGETLRIVDPSCGAGALLLGAYHALLELGRLATASHGLTENRAASSPVRVLEESVFGVDIDPCAVELTRLSLVLASWRQATGNEFSVPDIAGNIRHGDALELDTQPGGPPGIDWHGDFPATAGSGFDVVVGNPPWGQKSRPVDAARKRGLVRQYPSSKGIFDWFRPFLELAVSTTRRGGFFGMVLPDIVLLKNYETSRRYLLEQLTITDITWRGMAFADATIDAVTIAGQRTVADSDHRVGIRIEERGRIHRHTLRQADFLRNPRTTFNLFLTDERRMIIDNLAQFPRLGDHFEVHEGVHSGNIRSELFVSEAVDESCQPLYFGRAELRPYHLRWAGRHIRLSSLPARRSKARYANLGRRAWHQRHKLLIRRTSDAIQAALDERGWFASNNFFIAFARDPTCPLELDGLCALLNSALMTWLFRALEPRTGRAFAELKIKHLVDLPLPIMTAGRHLTELARLGRTRRQLCASGDNPQSERASELTSNLSGSADESDAQSDTRFYTGARVDPAGEVVPQVTHEVAHNRTQELDREIDRVVRAAFGLEGIALPEW